MSSLSLVEGDFDEFRQERLTAGRIGLSPEYAFFREAIGEVTAAAYTDTPRALFPVAERSCLAILEKLRREGRASERQGAWSTA